MSTAHSVFIRWVKAAAKGCFAETFHLYFLWKFIQTYQLNSRAQVFIAWRDDLCQPLLFCELMIDAGAQLQLPKIYC